uniref:ABC transporter ATP-binding protein n=1 Tax=Schlesneria paludicola TaxID=360056 RepID=A0A7C4QFZ1_9PLAN
MHAPVVEVIGVSYRYGARVALDGVSFDVAPGELFGVLGPNGGGKTTLFRLLTTVLPLQTGTIRLVGLDLAREPQEARRRLGITFQSPSVDGKLSVRENLWHQGHLYGWYGAALKERIRAVADAVGLTSRLADKVDTLSGGLKRRVEIAKSLLHEPSVLILDEPSTGLDPGVRADLWEFLLRLRRERQVTILVTTHLMDEAERCDRLAVFNAGKLVALGSPAALRGEIGGECLTIRVAQPAEFAAALRERWDLPVRVLDDAVRIEHPEALRLLQEIAGAHREQMQSVVLSRPTLEDVFLARTGKRFDGEGG